MKKYSFLTTLLIICGSLFSQSTYSGNLSVSDEGFFKGYDDSSDYYLGGCNAFPIGTFVNVKLPYSDDSVDVKIVTRIPEDGIFILIDIIAGKKLYLETGDVLPVRIQVVDFTPPPLSELDVELDPEPEIKGLTALSVSDDDLSIFEELAVVEDPAVTEDSTIAEEPAATEESTIAEEPAATEESTIAEEPAVTDESTIAEDAAATDESTIAEDLTVTEESTITEESDTTEESTVTEESDTTEESTVTKNPDIRKESELTEVRNEPDATLESIVPLDPAESELSEIIYEDELPVVSMFDEKITEENTDIEKVKEPITEIMTKQVKRIFFLEPANKKPPEGGIPDSDLIPVTTVEKDRLLEDGYYLQVGIYQNSDLVKIDTEKLDKLHFPYISVKEEDALKRERLLVGPVQNDELGVIMFHLKNRGFEDFFRYKKKLK